MDEADPDARIRILIVEDERVFAEPLQLYLERYLDADGKNAFEVVGLAFTSEEASELIESCEFDAVILDIELERKSYPSGLELAVAIREARPEARILISSAYLTVEGDLRRRASRVHGDRNLVQAILHKGQSLQKLVEVLQLIVRDKGVEFWTDPSLRPPRGYSAVADLTPAQDTFIRDFAQNGGHSPKAMRARLGVKSGAFNHHRSEIKEKVVKELMERGESVELDGESLSDEALFRWARDRGLHWPITPSEVPSRNSLRPNQ